MRRGVNEGASGSGRRRFGDDHGRGTEALAIRVGKGAGQDDDLVEAEAAQIVDQIPNERLAAGIEQRLCLAVRRCAEALALSSAKNDSLHQRARNRSPSLLTRMRQYSRRSPIVRS